MKRPELLFLSMFLLNSSLLRAGEKTLPEQTNIRSAPLPQMTQQIMDQVAKFVDSEPLIQEGDRPLKSQALFLTYYAILHVAHAAAAAASNAAVLAVCPRKKGDATAEERNAAFTKVFNRPVGLSSKEKKDPWDDIFLNPQEMPSFFLGLPTTEAEAAQNALKEAQDYSSWAQAKQISQRMAEWLQDYDPGWKASTAKVMAAMQVVGDEITPIVTANTTSFLRRLGNKTPQNLGAEAWEFSQRATLFEVLRSIEESDILGTTFALARGALLEQPPLGLKPFAKAWAPNNNSNFFPTMAKVLGGIKIVKLINGESAFAWQNVPKLNELGQAILDFLAPFRVCVDVLVPTE